MKSPLDEISDPYKFQQVVAQYFRRLKSERKDYFISDVCVENNGVGGDDGCDILVEFHFEDPIGRHCHKWVIECKSQANAVSPKDIPSSIETILRSNKAKGYLLICKYDATASLKRHFKKNKENSNSEFDYVIWDGTQLWDYFSKHLTFIEQHFPKYYFENYVKNKALENYESFVNDFSQKLENK